MKKQASSNTDHSHWIFGIFYYNKNDHRIFPPKRIKYFGWTVNFANPFSILAFLTLLSAVLGLGWIFANKI